MGEKKAFSFLITGGQANAGPPIGPALGPLGVNMMAIVNSINEQTKEYSGMRIPVKVTIDVETKEFEVEVGVPTTSALIVKEAKLKKGSGSTGSEFVGELSIDQVVKIARLKLPQSYAKDLKACVKEVLGTCLTMGVKVEGGSPKELIGEVEEMNFE